MVSPLDIKSLLNDPEKAIVCQWGEVSLCPDANKIFENVSQVKSLKAQLKAAKQKKQELSRQFKEVKKGDDLIVSALKEQMKLVSDELRELDGKRKRTERELHDFFDQKDNAPELPLRFSYELPSNPAHNDINVVLVESGVVWDGYVKAHSNASLYHLYQWQEVIAKSFGHSSRYLMALDQRGNCIGIMPVILMKSRLFGCFAVSVPFFNYGAPLADSTESACALMDAATDYCEHESLSHLEVRSTYKLNQWPVRSDKISMILLLPKSQTQLDQRLGAKVRAQINRADDYDLSIKFGGIDLLDDYYRVFSINMRDLGTPVYDKMFFKNILMAFHELAKIAVVYKNGMPIATGFVIGFNDVLEIPWASTLRKYNYTNANMFLYRKILGFAIDSGFDYFDFGRSTKEASTYRFKKQWGAKPVEHYWHYYLAEGEELPALNPNNPKYQIAISVWRRLPVWLTQMIGPHLVKNLP